MSKKVSVRDVAKHAGVSVAAVSYVLNGINKVSEATKKIILNSIEELGYEVNLIAKGLSTGKSKLIGVILPITEQGDSTNDLLENPFFSEFFRGIEKTFQNEEYDFIISGLNVQGNYKNWIKRRKLDGIILLGAYPKSIYEEIKELNIPVVVNDIYEDNNLISDFHCVRIDDELGSYEATKHLISLGHTNIGFASGNKKSSRINQERFNGYVRALNEAGISLNDDYIFEELSTLEGGKIISQKIIKNKINISAIHVAADIMAIGIIKEYQKQGKSIPEDLSIVGYDDIQLSRFITPALTTINQDILYKSEISARLLLKDLRKRTSAKELKIIKPKLIVRKSTDRFIDNKEK